MTRALLIALGLGLSAPVAFAGQAAEQALRQAADTVTSAPDSEVPDAILDQLNMEKISQFVLGKYNRRIDEADRARFTGALESSLRGQIEANTGILADAEIEVLNSRDRSETDSIVTTHVTPVGEARQTVRWRLLEDGGEWNIVDVEVAGIWLAIEQRAQVDALMAERGATIDDVIARLNG